MKAIVTGANGFIGSAVILNLLNAGYEVVGLGRENTKSKIPVNNNYKYLTCNLNNINDLTNKLLEKNYDYFFHFAWDGSAGEKRADIQLQLENVKWTVESLRIAKKLGCTKFIGAGSITERETLYSCYEDNKKPGKGYIYGSAKVAAHNISKIIAADIDIDIVWGVITNAYGIGENSPRLINMALRKIINNEIPEFTSAVQNYDFVYIDDVANAFKLLAEKGKPFCDYVIGSGNAKSLKSFLIDMQNSVASDMSFSFGNIPFSGVNLPLKEFDTSKIYNDTGFVASTNFLEGTKKTYEWLKKMELDDDK